MVALGEAGLDYFYDNGSPQAQARGFRAHIAAARMTGLPLVIHARDADEDCGRILEEEVARGPFRAVLHCYTGGRDLAMKAIELGLSISFTGILTFKKSDALRALARFDFRKAQVVELRFFGGLSVEESAEVLKVSPITVMRDWSTARAWLYRELSGKKSDGLLSLETDR